jgi:hypothetical protein
VEIHDAASVVDAWKNFTQVEVLGSNPALPVLIAHKAEISQR